MKPDTRAQLNEFVSLMTDLAARDRDEYRKLRQEMWDRIAQHHAEKTPEQLESWRENAS